MIDVQQATLAAIVESSDDAIISKTLDGIILTWNQGAERIFGYTAQEAIGRHIAMLIPPDRQAEEATILDRIRHGKRVESFETVRVTKDGRQLSISVTVSPIKDKSGKVIGASKIARDITARKRTEQELCRLRSELEQRVVDRTALAERRTSQLRAMHDELTRSEEGQRRRLAHLLHDQLQQLLIAARLKMGVVRQGNIDEGLRQTVDQVEELIDQSIKESRSLTMELSPPVLYDAGLVSGLRWLVRKLAKENGIRVELVAGPDVEPADENSRVFVFQAVRELLSNVRRHARTDSARVELKCLDAKRLEISVSDNGVGFDPATLKEQVQTKGLGLLSLRERLELIGGRLTIDAASGRGARITLVLPWTGVPEPTAQGVEEEPALSRCGLLPRRRVWTICGRSPSSACSWPTTTPSFAAGWPACSANSRGSRSSARPSTARTRSTSRGRSCPTSS